MPRDTDPAEERDVVREKYEPDQEQSLSDAVIETIETYTGEDVSKLEYVLYDDVDPDAIDGLFRDEASPRTTVGFDTEDVRVELFGDDGVVIEVTDRPT